MTDTRLTLRQAAAVLDVSESAIRKRVERGTLRSDKGPDGKRYVYLDTVADNMADERADTSATPERDVLISELRAHNDTLREQLEAERQAHAEARRLLMRALERIPPAIEAPSEARESPETVEEEPERAEPRPDRVETQEGTERPQQRSGWLAPVDKLPWWQYGLGVFLVFSGGFLAFTLQYRFPIGTPDGVRVPILLAGAWSPPGFFGFWVGCRKRNLRLWSQMLPLGALVGGVALLGVDRGLYGSFSFVSFAFLDDPDLLAHLAIVFFPAWLLFVSASLVGNAWQRRRTGRISGTTPTSPVSRATRGAAQQPRKDLTPTQQAILGWGGAIISAFITLVGTIFAAGS